MASLTRWTWVWADSGRSWRTGKPSVLQSLGLQRVGHDWVTEPQQHMATIPRMSWQPPAVALNWAGKSSSDPKSHVRWVPGAGWPLALLQGPQAGVKHGPRSSFPFYIPHRSSFLLLKKRQGEGPRGEREVFTPKCPGGKDLVRTACARHTQGPLLPPQQQWEKGPWARTAAGVLGGREAMWSVPTLQCWAALEVLQSVSLDGLLTIPHYTKLYSWRVGNSAPGAHRAGRTPGTSAAPDSHTDFLKLLFGAGWGGWAAEWGAGEGPK